MMTSETLNALKASIEHWKRLASGRRAIKPSTGELEGIYGDDCALCGLFMGYGSLAPYCADCPVRLKTGKAMCEDSPWAGAAKAKSEHGINSLEFRGFAAAEVLFLESLLPQETENKNETNVQKV